MLCFQLDYKNKKICIPALVLIPYPWHLPHPIGPDDYRPQPDAVTKALGLNEESLRVVTGLAFAAYGMSLLPEKLQAPLRESLAKSVAEQQRSGIPLQLS